MKVAGAVIGFIVLIIVDFHWCRVIQFRSKTAFDEMDEEEKN